MTATREISRHAVRAELARVAFDNFCLSGFDTVTFGDLAEAAQVSRSTFMRYFGTKEEVVLFVFDPVGDVLRDVVTAHLHEQDDWVVLDEAVSAALKLLVNDVPNIVTILDLVGKTPALCSRLRLKQDEWRAQVADSLMDRPSPSDGDRLAIDVRVAAALESLWIVLAQWTARAGTVDVEELLIRAGDALVRRESASI